MTGRSLTRSNVTRTRTGCLTCRRRRKKCDERKPMCRNCEKTNLVCEGFPQRLRWQQARDARGGEPREGGPSQASSPPPGFRAPPALGTEAAGLDFNTLPQVSTAGSAAFPTSEASALENAGYLAGPSDTVAGEAQNHGYVYAMSQHGNTPYFQDPSTAVFDQKYGSYVGAGSFDESLETIYTPLAMPYQQGVPHQGYNPVVGSYHDTSLVAMPGGHGDNRPPQSILPYVSMLREIPFLIPSVNTKTKERMFCHFTNVMSHLLTASNGDSNPMNAVVIPMAIEDPTLMNCILSLSGSHLLKLLAENTDPQLKIERDRLHREARQIQARRTQSLIQSTAASQSPFSMRDQELILATSLLLCLYEICEGTGNDAWREHLDTAREVITVSSASSTSSSPDKQPSQSIAPQPQPAPEPIITDVDPFLLEFFIYHDSLATVTVPSLLTKSQPKYIHRTSTSIPEQNDAFMIGVRDGLFDFITRIATLRGQADASKRQPDTVDGDVLSKAVPIWQDLSTWRPDPRIISSDHKLIAEFYQWALFIWLFSIVNPNSKSEPKIQNAVKRIAHGMGKINDNSRACLLFPLFVIGSAAITAEDRAAVAAQFQRLKEWSSLGNIDLTFKVVEKIWWEHDEGMVGSWDWVRQLERHGMSLLVT